MGKHRLSAGEIDKLIDGRDYREFLNRRNELFRKKNMAENPPSREEAIRLMAEEPNLIRRPVIIAGKRVIAGFDEDEIERL